MVKNNVLLLLHPSKWHVEEQRRFKTKKYYHRIRGPVWVVAVQWPPQVTTPTEKNIFFSLNFFSSQVNWEFINGQTRNTEWEWVVLHADDPEAMLDTLLVTILRACQENVPVKRRQYSTTCDIPIERKILMKRLAALNWRILKATNDTQKSSLQAKVSAVENKIKELHEKQRDLEENEAVHNIKVNSKFFFKYCKKFSKTQVRVGPTNQLCNRSIAVWILR